MKSIVVVGAYGGMGRATVLKLVENGYEVYALDKIVKEKEDHIHPIICDVTNIDSINEAYELVHKETDDIYAIIHFVGIYYLDSLIEITKEKYENIYKINVFGPYLINKTFLPLLKKGSRIIITTSELATLDPLPFTGLYAITKGALDKYSYSLAMELALLDINVSVIRPGAVKTEMLNVSTNELDEFCNNTKLYNVSSKNFRDVVNKVETKSIAPTKVARVVLKILNKKHPRFNYAINRNKLLILLNILPKGWRFKIIKKILKNDN